MWLNKLRLLGYEDLADKTIKLSDIIDLDDLYIKELQSNLNIILEDKYLDILKYLIYKYIYETEDNMRIAIYKITKDIVEYKDDIITSIMIMTDSKYDLKHTLKYVEKNGLVGIKHKYLTDMGIQNFKTVIKENKFSIKNVKTNEIYKGVTFDDIIHIGLDTEDIYVEYKDRIVKEIDKKLYMFIGTYNDCMSVYYKLSDEYRNFCYGRLRTRYSQDEKVFYKLEKILAECLGSIHSENIDSSEAISILGDDKLWKYILNKDSTELGEFTDSLDSI